MTYVKSQVKHLPDQANGQLFEVAFQLGSAFIAFIASEEDLIELQKAIDTEVTIYQIKKPLENGQEHLQHDSIEKAEQ